MEGGGSGRFLFTSSFRHKWGSIFAGVLFSVGWLLWVDGAIIGTQWEGYKTPPWYAYLPGVFSTAILLLMNMVSLNDLHPFALMFSQDISGKVRAWLFVCFALAFGNIAASIYICVDSYEHEAGGKLWPGISLVLQNGIIFFSSVILLFARRIEEEDDYASLSI